jgi:deazaflavin-dependent oxidoreductase (nitroreductase family)
MRQLIALGLFALLARAVFLRLRQAAGMRRRDPAAIEHKRRSNSRATNRLIRSLGRAGKRFSPFALVCHTGRRSGIPRRTPIRLVHRPDGFVVPLTYGQHVDWYRNLEAAGGGQIVWQGRTYLTGAPQPLEADGTAAMFPLPSRFLFWLDGVDQFCWLPVSQAAAASSRLRAEA